MFFVISLVTGAIVLEGFTLFQWLSLFRTGSVADVRAGVQAGVKPVRDRGMLVSQVVIPRPSPELFEEYIGSGADAMRTMLLVDQFQ
ncbi:MAG: BMC domain-containing protein [Isosphaeraceae bacterium]